VLAATEGVDVKYVLLFVETEQFAKDLEAMDQADRDRAFMLAGQWFMEHADKVKEVGASCDHLTPRPRCAWTVATPSSSTDRSSRARRW
jgi:hypothetical protein